MAKMFNDKEKQIIRDKLMEKGKEYFSTFGIKKTSVEELTNAAGIAKGSFYHFFSSKEELYFDLLEKEEESLKEEILNSMMQSKIITRSDFKQFLLQTLHKVDDNPFFRRLYNQDEYELLVRKVPQERLDAHAHRDMDVMITLIQKWQDQGQLISEAPEIIAGVLRSFFLLTLHKKEIGATQYNATIELIAHCIANGLIQEQAEIND
jgi:AcrR family transcriptional regulator